MMFNSKYARLATTLSPFLVFLGAYFGGRVFFKFVIEAKQAFIYPSGVLVKAFVNVGDFISGEWLFVLGQTHFVLGESCSGTSFFCLLSAYIAYSVYTKSTHFLWFLGVYPITLFANSLRVISSIYSHSLALKMNLLTFRDDMHLACGVFSFLIVFLSVVIAVEYLNVKKYQAH